MIRFFIGANNYSCQKLLAIPHVEGEPGFIELLADVTDCDNGGLPYVDILVTRIL